MLTVPAPPGSGMLRPGCVPVVGVVVPPPGIGMLTLPASPGKGMLTVGWPPPATGKLISTSVPGIWKVTGCWPPGTCGGVPPPGCGCVGGTEGPVGVGPGGVPGVAPGDGPGVAGAEPPPPPPPVRACQSLHIVVMTRAVSMFDGNTGSPKLRRMVLKTFSRSRLRSAGLFLADLIPFVTMNGTRRSEGSRLPCSAPSISPVSK